jgi:hypothetical protein
MPAVLLIMICVLVSMTGYYTLHACLLAWPRAFY